MQRLRVLSEQECYLRCYGWVGSEDIVKVRTRSTLQPRHAVSAESIRRKLEARIDTRDAEAA